MRKTIVQLVDDLDGGEAEESVTFALDGSSYEIDLSKNNASALRSALDEYIAHARKVGAQGKRSSGNTDSASRTHAIRKWAQENGHKVSARGRVPAIVVSAYEAAHDRKG